MNYSSVVTKGRSVASSAQSAASDVSGVVSDAQIIAEELQNVFDAVSNAVESCFGITFSNSLNFNVGDIFGFIKTIDIPDYLLNNPIVKAILAFVIPIYNTIMKYYAKLQTMISDVLNWLQSTLNEYIAWFNQKKEDILKNPCVQATVGSLVQEQFDKYKVDSVDIAGLV